MWGTMSAPKLYGAETYDHLVTVWPYTWLRPSSVCGRNIMECHTMAPTQERFSDSVLSSDGLDLAISCNTTKVQLPFEPMLGIQTLGDISIDRFTSLRYSTCTASVECNSLILRAYRRNDSPEGFQGGCVDAHGLEQLDHGSHARPCLSGLNFNENL